MMNIHHRIFKILVKNQSVTDGRTDGRATWKQYTQKQRKFAGYNKFWNIVISVLVEC